MCFGHATRFAQFLLDAPKRYVATIRFGTTTTTQDAEGDVTATKPVAFTRDELEAALRRFTGPILQTPPAHSALKFEGRPHYEYARRGIDVPRTPREVTIHALELIDWTPPDATLDVSCSKGTYIRMLAADLGDALGCGAHLAALRRTASGGFDIADAVTLVALDAMEQPLRDAALLPALVLVDHLPKLSVSGEAARRFRQGQPVAAGAQKDGNVAVFEADALLGVADVQDGLAHPRRVVAGADSYPPGKSAIRLIE